MGWGTTDLVLLLLLPCGFCLDQWGPIPPKDPSSWGSLRNWLPGSHSQVGVSYSGPWVPSGGPARSRALSPLQPVAVQCQEAAMVVTVQRDLFGTGKLVQAADLMLGATFCSYTSANADNTVTFQVALQDCGNTLQVTPEFLVYSSILTYTPTTFSSRVITRTNAAAVLVQCVYPRNSNVSSLAIQPTWTPFRSTVSHEEVLSMSLRLMTDDWSSARTSNTFQLGDVFHLEASVDAANNFPLRIYVDSCVATLSPELVSTPQYDIVGSFGCMIDGKTSDASAFVAPRPQPGKLRFTVDAFRFIGDARPLLYITCSLQVVLEEAVPNPSRKACSFRRSSGWTPVEGPAGICSCCEAMSCTPPESRTFYSYAVPRRFEKRGEPFFASQDFAVGPLLVVDDAPVDEGSPVMAILDQLEAKPGSLQELQAELLALEQEVKYPSAGSSQQATSDSEDLRKGDSLAVQLGPLESNDLALVEDWPEPGMPLLDEQGFDGQEYEVEPKASKKDTPIPLAGPLEDPKHAAQVVGDHKIQQSWLAQLTPTLVLNKPDTTPTFHHKAQKVQLGLLLGLEKTDNGPKLDPAVSLQLNLNAKIDGLVNVGAGLPDSGNDELPEAGQHSGVASGVATAQVVHSGPVLFLEEFPPLNDDPSNTLESQMEPRVELKLDYPDLEGRSETFPSQVLQVTNLVEASMTTTANLVAPSEPMKSVPNGTFVVGEAPLSEEHQPEHGRDSNLILLEHGNESRPGLFEAWQGGSEAGPTPPLLTHYVPLQKKGPLSASGWTGHTSLVEAQPAAEEREQRVEVILLVVAGVVLICIMALGAFLVYRRGQAFV
ncbi:uncharacterized protein [Ambystoma mexicanum]|uniref:uncharacterized protein n=1 Tax=Ambystoma mexicanum TaxID=8296 RepID=UPI0037E96615